MEINQLLVVEFLFMSFELIFVTELITVSGSETCSLVIKWLGCPAVVALLKIANCYIESVLFTSLITGNTDASLTLLTQGSNQLLLHFLTVLIKLRRNANANPPYLLAHLVRAWC